MNLRPEALSRDGYIIDQRRTDNIPFGVKSSQENGCGWIAAYNFLKALERDPDPEQLLLDMEKGLLFQGRLGVNLFSLIRELKRQKLPLNYSLGAFHAQCQSERCRAGIILYFTGKRNHYAAFRREESGKLRFFGAEPGRADDEGTLAEFYANHVKFPLAVTITAR